MNKVILTFCATLILISESIFAQGIYQKPEVFLAEIYSNDPPKVSIFWLKKNLRPEIKKIMGHDLGFLRLRYWDKDGLTVWILDEIGKEKPITVGFVIKDGIIEKVKILAFRESRGGEIRYLFFTDQFKGAHLKQGTNLDRDIDGISGATLSVRAVKNSPNLLYSYMIKVELRRINRL